MKLHDLKTNTSQPRKRVGRGISAGQGKTAGRGTKGQGSRAGFSRHSVFEGGQSPLTMRLPKLKGFTSKRPAVQVVHTDQLERFKVGQTIGPVELKAAGLVAHTKQPIKLLARGKVTKPLTVALARVSKTAAEQVKAAGGKIIAKSAQARTSVKTKS